MNIILGCPIHLKNSIDTNKMIFMIPIQLKLYLECFRLRNVTKFLKIGYHIFQLFKNPCKIHSQSFDEHLPSRNLSVLFNKLYIFQLLVNSMSYTTIQLATHYLARNISILTYFPKGRSIDVLHFRQRVPICTPIVTIKSSGFSVQIYEFPRIPSIQTVT